MMTQTEHQTQSGISRGVLAAVGANVLLLLLTAANVALHTFPGSVLGLQGVSAGMPFPVNGVVAMAIGIVSITLAWRIGSAKNRFNGLIASAFVTSGALLGLGVWMLAL